MSRFKVGILGGGSWGTTVAALVSRNAPVTLWAKLRATAAAGQIGVVTVQTPWTLAPAGASLGLCGAAARNA